MLVKSKERAIPNMDDIVGGIRSQKTEIPNGNACFSNGNKVATDMGASGGEGVVFIQWLSSFIARSRPSSVRGYIRLAMTSRISPIDGV